MKEEDLEWEVSSPNKAEFVASFTANYRPPKNAVQHFASIPWTNDWITNPAYETIPFWSRHTKSSGEDYYFSKTINTETTIPHMVTLERKGWVTSERTLPAPTANNAPGASSLTANAAAGNNKPPAIVVLVQLGEQGVDGHPKVIHGGVTCALLDEIMSLVLMQHRMNLRGSEPWGSTFTANLNTNFRAPVPTPAAVIVKCWLVGGKGRKWLTRGQIEDEHGRILADANAVWVVARSDKI